MMKRSLPLILLLLLLVGCNRAPETVTLTVGIPNLATRYAQLFDAFERQHPEIELDFRGFSGANGSQYSTNQIRHSAQEDIYITTRSEDKEPEAAANLLDLSAYAFVNRVNQGILEDFAIDGGLYLLPLRNLVYGLFYNKTYMDEWGLEVPKDYKDLVALSKECQKRGVLFSLTRTILPGVPTTFLTNIAKMGFLSTVDGMLWERDFFSGKDVDYAIWDDTLDYIQKLIDLGIFRKDPSIGTEDPRNAFYNGASLLYFDHSTFNKEALAGHGFEFGMMPLISEDGSRNIYWYTPDSFIGLSKSLTEPGNEKKLEAALTFMDFLLTEEGQNLLDLSVEVLPVIKSRQVDYGSAIYDAWIASQEGRVMRRSYESWNMLGLTIPLGNIICDWADGKATASDVISTMKKVRDESIASGGPEILGTVTEDMSAEQMAPIVAAALGNMVDTDVAVVSIGTYIDGVGDKTGVSGPMYKGGFTQEDSWVPLPGSYGRIAVLTLSGADIKAMVADGHSYNDRVFPYVLATRAGIVLDDASTYRVAMTVGSYSDEMAEKGSAQIVTSFGSETFLNAFTAALVAMSPLSPGMAWL